jgi:hypothetical protein
MSAPFAASHWYDDLCSCSLSFSPHHRYHPLLALFSNPFWKATATTGGLAVRQAAGVKFFFRVREIADR